MGDWAKFAGFAALLVLALGGSLFWALDNPQQNREWTCKAQTNSNNQETGTLNTFTCHPSQSSDLQQQADSTNSNRNEDRGNNVKVTDKLLAVFTGFLVLVGAVQGYYLWIAGEATTKSVEFADRALRSLERPYIIPIDPIFIRTDKFIYADLYVVNCGKTFGNISEVNAQFLNEENLLPVPPYDDRETKGKDITAIPIVMVMQERIDARVQLGRFSTLDLNAKWFFGYFLYNGLIERNHRTWFCYRLPAEGNGNGVTSDDPVYSGYN